MTLETRIRAAERSLFERRGIAAEESWVELPHERIRVRVLGVGDGTPLVLLHGVSVSSAIWAPWAARLPGYRLLLVDLPGHGLSGPLSFRVGGLRDRAVGLLDELLEVLAPQPAAVVGHSLGGMLALWHAAARPGRIGSVVALGAPAVALPGTTVRMPLSLMTVPMLGSAVLRMPTPRVAYRSLLDQGLGRGTVRVVPPELVEALRLAGKRRENARSVASLMHALDRFRRPRPESVLSGDELRRLEVPTLFCWGRRDPYLPPDRARPWIEAMPAATLRELDAGHAPWLEEPEACAAATLEHLRASGFPPRASR